MAEQITQDVVKEAQSAGDVLPVDVNASTTNTTAGNGPAANKPINLDSQLNNISPVTTDTKEHLVNGYAGENSAAESQHTGAYVSGSSDTDISRPGSVDQAQRPGGHLRTNSIKKPTSFKSVSVTKNFLAKSAVSAPAVRSGDKSVAPGQSTSSALLSAKPRLVAKSGSGNVPRSGGQMNGAGSGPDGSKVWNKNQPVPPPPPKQFTDEELKQQYGIHLATRLQADEGSKEAKWADIDDEDDWAPETVQWMDGTKSTVAAVESQPLPAPLKEPKPANKPQPPAVTSKPSTPVPAANASKTTLTGGTKTILKPGAHAPKSNGQADKPTLVAKPTASAPVKSPWAPLPPVEKVSPVAINPPAQPLPPSTRYTRDVPSYDAMPPPSLPAKEIAPDDFNRSWRDERGNRELFNSHSGRYEPVRDVRRGSIRDGNVRQQPSVLQRPSHDGPAEPSAAFQTSRSSVDGPTWGRRRNSSNVSGGSGRVSFDARGSDHSSIPMNMTRRESQSTHAGEPGLTGPQRHTLPPRPLSNDQQPSALAPRPSPSMSQVQPASPLGSITSQDATAPRGGSQPIQNLVEVQQRVMHDNIDSIKLRKQKEMEREAKEEADRKERLRKKMEALGFTDEPKKDKEASPSRPPQKSPLKEKAVPAPMQSPPKPPVPSSEGEVAQYGMIKVHQPQPVKKSLPSDALLPKSRAARPGPSPADKAQPELEPKLSTSLAQSSGAPSLTHTKRPEPTQPHVHSQVQPQPQTLQPGQTAAKPNQPTQPSATWSNASLPQQSRPWTSSLWGPPQTKDRALGNGTFGQQVAPQPQASQTPIGVNPALKSTAPHQQTAPAQPFAPQPMYSQGAAAPKQASMGPTARPLAPGWGDFQAQIRRDDQAQIAKAQEDYERRGGDSFIPEIRETFKGNKGLTQTTLHTQIGGLDMKTPQNGSAIDLKPKEDVPRASLEGPTPTHMANQGPHAHPTAQGPRSSRFFPRASEAAAPVISSTSEGSPPPPETQTHPAHSGDSASPVVNLPRPPPRVRLPPAMLEPATQPDAPVSMPPRTRLTPGIGTRPLVLSEEWQTRFNNLLAPSSAGISPSGIQPLIAPEVTGQNTGSLQVASSSKAPLDNRQPSAPATVSLPHTVSRKIFIDDNSSDVTSRTSADTLLEDREFGSLPTVALPKVPHMAASEPPAVSPSPGRQNSRQGSRYGRWPDMEMFSKPSYNGEFDKHSETIEIRIKFGRIQEAVVKSMPRRRKNGKGPAQSKPRRSFQAASPTSSGQNQRQRKPSNYQSQGSNSNTSPHTASGGAWSNNRSAPSHSNQAWGRRTAPTAPVH